MRVCLHLMLQQYSHQCCCLPLLLLLTRIGQPLNPLPFRLWTLVFAVDYCTLFILLMLKSMLDVMIVAKKLRYTFVYDSRCACVAHETLHKNTRHWICQSSQTKCVCIQKTPLIFANARNDIRYKLQQNVDT